MKLHLFYLKLHGLYQNSGRRPSDGIKEPTLWQIWPLILKTYGP